MVETTPVGGEARRGKGCLFWGCSTILLVLVIAGGAIGWAVWSIKAEIEEHSSDVRVPLTAFEPSPQQVQRVEERVTELEDRARADGGRVEFGAEELNVLLKRAPQLAEVVHVSSIEGDKARLEISVPLDQLGYEGRFLNGEALVGMTEESGELKVTVDELTTREGVALPHLRSAVELFVRTQLRARLQGAEADSLPPDDIRRVLLERGRMEIRDGRLILEADAAPEAE